MLKLGTFRQSQDGRKFYIDVVVKLGDCPAPSASAITGMAVRRRNYPVMYTLPLLCLCFWHIYKPPNISTLFSLFYYMRPKGE